MILFRPLLSIVLILCLFTFVFLFSNEKDTISHFDNAPDSKFLSSFIKKQKLINRTDDFGLSNKWCGQSSYNDLKTNPLGENMPRFKIYYVHPNDYNRFNKVSSLIQNNFLLATQILYSASNYTKVYSFDMGSSCGPKYLDIQNVILDKGKDDYAEDENKKYSFSRELSKIEKDPYIRPIFLVDGIWESYLGFATMGGANDNLNPTFMQSNKKVYLMFNNILNANNDMFPLAIIHETFHTLGAVDNNSPHSTGAHHCTDGFDIMCYADGGPKSNKYSSKSCQNITRINNNLTRLLDCNQDDYFSPAPKEGTYLTSPNAWNTYNSVFLTECINQSVNACIFSSNSKSLLKNGNQKIILPSIQRSYNGAIETTYKDKDRPSYESSLDNSLPLINFSVTSKGKTIITKVKLDPFFADRGKYLIKSCVRYSFSRKICKKETIILKKRQIAYPKGIRLIRYKTFPNNYASAILSITKNKDKILTQSRNSPKLKIW